VASPFGKINVLLLKPYQPVANITHAPPLGPLYLASALRERLGDQVVVDVVDAKLHGWDVDDLQDVLSWAHVVGISALNYEALVAFAVADAAKALDPQKLVVLGGPLTHLRAQEMLQRCDAIDWVFDGESDRMFPLAIERWINGTALGADLLGLYRRDPDYGLVTPPGNDFVEDLDALPLPAWDLVEFEKYARSSNMNRWMKGERYASIFTSRGCPYKCAYCHDIFTKKFRWRSAENVLAEIDLLVREHDVDEFQIIDDIFNLHKPRLKTIMAKVRERYGCSLHFCFPNGLRGDILDRSVIEALHQGGTYQITVAVETVSDRLQRLIQKDLDVAKVSSFIDYCAEAGILVKGYFMLGFPTETREEIWNTIRFAWRSKLSFATFFTVIPQPETPLYKLAEQESEDALREVEVADYQAAIGWYERAYGYPLSRVTRGAITVFYLHPVRIWKVLRQAGIRQMGRFFLYWVQVVSKWDMMRTQIKLKRGLRLRRTWGTREPREPDEGAEVVERPAKA